MKMANGLVTLAILLAFDGVTSASTSSTESEILSMIAKLQEKVSTLQSHNAKQDSVISSLQSHIATQDHEISSLKEQGKRQNDMISALMRQWRLHDKPISDWSDINMVLTDEIKEQKEQIATQPDPAGTLCDQIQTPDQQGGRKPKTRSMIGVQSVAFQAVASADTVSHIGLHQKIVFDSVYLNLGGSYHSLNGVFIAPRAGIYLFATSVLSERHGSINVSIMKNGIQLGSAYTEAGDGTIYDQGSVTAVVQLDAGDEVWVENRWPPDAKIHGRDKNSSFTGVLVIAM